jgi:hypothetical protein
MMTVGEHDSAWLDVMRNRVPSIDQSLAEISASMRYRNILFLLKESYRVNLLSLDEYADLLRVEMTNKGLVKDSAKKEVES